MLRIIVLSLFSIAAFAEGFKDDGSINHTHHDGDGINNLWVFGDSMSDSSMNKLTSGGGDTNWNGRNSNGENWVDWLGTMSRIRTSERQNFSVSGATTGKTVYGGGTSTDGNPWGYQWGNMGIQNQIKIAKDKGLKFGKNDLVTIWGGGNDYLQFIGSNDSGIPLIKFGNGVDENSDADVAATTLKMAQNNIDSANMVKDMGAKHILVPMWVRMNQVPNILRLTLPSGMSREDFNKKSNQFWDKYRNNLIKKTNEFANNNSNITVYFVNTDIAYEYLRNNSELFGIAAADRNKICTEELQKQGKLKRDADNKGRARNDCSKYLSFDGTHPTSHVQKLIAESYNSLLQMPRFNRRMVHSSNTLVDSVLDLNDSNIETLLAGNANRVAVNSSLTASGGRIKVKPSDGRMGGEADSRSLAVSYNLSPTMGVSLGHASLDRALNREGYTLDQSIYMSTLYGIKKFANPKQYLLYRAYYAQLDFSDLSRKTLARKVHLKGDTSGYRTGFDLKFNRQFNPRFSYHLGLGYANTQIDGYAEKTGLDTGLGVKIDDISATRSYLAGGIKYKQPITDNLTQVIKLGAESDLSNKIDQYAIRSIDGDVPSYIQKREIEETTTLASYQMTYAQGAHSWLGSVHYRGNSMAKGYNMALSYQFKF